MIRRILLAYDGSDSSDKAFRLAADLAGKYGAELRVLTVAQTPDLGDEVEATAAIEQSRLYHEALLESIKARAAGDGIEARFELRIGHPARQILDCAEGEGVDLIVMGHRGRGLIDRWRLGSVSHRVISFAECAVTVVH
jgi:nucleotide-binding universal stress UspA family protein